MNEVGCVYLVGAGPGDPDLLTVKAMRLITSAEVVVYDRLVADEVMALVPAGTTRIYAGKRPGHHQIPQEDINDLLVSLARSGRKVVRLKGGDPFVFGRGSEEALYLGAHNVPFEIVPGITAAAGCSAYAGIPLTHRAMATSVRFLTGHFRDGAELDFDWKGLADPDTTLVVYMGLGNLPAIAERLIAAGRSADTPAAAVENGTTGRQRVAEDTLAGLAGRLETEGFRTPTMIVIGPVVTLRRDLAWWAPPAPVETLPDADMAAWDMAAWDMADGDAAERDAASRERRA